MDMIIGVMGLDIWNMMDVRVFEKSGRDKNPVMRHHVPLGPRHINEVNQMFRQPMRQ